MNIERGVSRYIKGTATIFFPEGHVCCDLCPALETYARKQCRLTGKYLLDTRVIDDDCPMKFEEDKHDEV